MVDDRDVFSAEYSDGSPIVAIVRAISVMEGCKVENVPELNKYVEPDSINRLLEHASERDQDVTVQLAVEDYEVAIDSTGTISIRACE